jgi:hypothetical protein
MKLFKGKGEFAAAVRGYVAMGSSRSDQDQYRLDVIGASLFHGLAHANFDAGNRVAASTLGAIQPDVQKAISECRKAWEGNGKANFTEKDAEAKASELLQPVILALRELRDTQDRNKEENKRRKEAEARAAALAKLESEAQGKPSPFMLKGPDGTVELSQEEFDTLMGLLADVRKGDIATTVDVRNRVAVAA